MIQSSPVPKHTTPRLPFWEWNRRKIAMHLGVDLTHSQVRYAAVLEKYITPGCRWLEVGCGRQILPDWAMPMQSQKTLVDRAGSIIGLDVDAAIVEHPLLTYKVKGFGNKMPLRCGAFDLVTANMVVEHVDNPAEFLTEIRRVLRPGGRFLFHTTNFANYAIFISYFVPDPIKHRIIWMLERRKSEDVFPTLYQMNTKGMIERLAAKTEFSIEDLRTNGTCGYFSRLGPIGWLELVPMKLMASSNIIGVLRKT